MMYMYLIGSLSAKRLLTLNTSHHEIFEHHYHTGIQDCMIMVEGGVGKPNPTVCDRPTDHQSASTISGAKHGERERAQREQ